MACRRPRISTFGALPAPLPIWQRVVDRDGWARLRATIAQARRGRLVSMWGVDRSAAGEGLRRLRGLRRGRRPGLARAAAGRLRTQRFPDLSAAFPCAGRMQRAMADLSGLHADGSPRPAALARPRPVARRAAAAAPTVRSPRVRPAGTLPADYPFVRVEGDGVHEIAVGPVHAGIIEPGHFRFSVVGEKVLRLEQHLGYVHKGIERRFTELAPLEAHRLAGGCRATRPWPTPGPTAWRWSRPAARRSPRAPHGCAR